MNIRIELIGALSRVYKQIDAEADKHKRWLRATVVTLNRSEGQRARWAKHRSRT